MRIGDLLTPRPARTFADLARVLTDLRNRVSTCSTNVTAVLTDTAHILRHLHDYKEMFMVTKQEILDQLADVKTVLGETAKDVGRVADKLDQAVANGDLSEVAAAVAELKQMAEGIDARAEQSDPEQPADPAEPVGEQPAGEVDGGTGPDSGSDSGQPGGGDEPEQQF